MVSLKSDFCFVTIATLQHFDMHSKKMLMKQELDDLLSFLIQLLWCTVININNCSMEIWWLVYCLAFIFMLNRAQQNIVVFLGSLMAEKSLWSPNNNNQNRV